MSRDVQRPDTWSRECFIGHCQGCSGYDADGDGLCECRHHETETDTEHYKDLLRDQR